MKKFFNYLTVLVMTFVAMSLSSCHSASPDADEEAVLIEKPIIFGHGGVDEVPVTSGLTWCWFSTDVEYVKITPVAYNEHIEDAAAEAGVLLDWDTQIILQVESGKSPILLKNYGKDWYINNIQKVYTSHFYNVVGDYDSYQLISDRAVTDSIENIMLNYMRVYVDSLSAHKEFPVIVKKVITGKAIPNEPLRNELDRTAAIIQQKKSNDMRTQAEQSRTEAEKQRAIADKAYMNEMNLTADQFIALKAWEIIEKKQGANIDVLFDGSASKMWNVRR